MLDWLDLLLNSSFPTFHLHACIVCLFNAKLPPISIPRLKVTWTILRIWVYGSGWTSTSVAFSFFVAGFTWLPCSPLADNWQYFRFVNSCNHDSPFLIMAVFDKDTKKTKKKVKVHNTWLENPFYRVTDVEAPRYQTSMASHVKDSHLWSQTAQHVLISILLYNSLN